MYSSSQRWCFLHTGRHIHMMCWRTAQRSFRSLRVFALHVVSYHKLMIIVCITSLWCTNWDVLWELTCSFPCKSFGKRMSTILFLFNVGNQQNLYMRFQFFFLRENLIQERISATHYVQNEMWSFFIFVIRSKIRWFDFFIFQLCVFILRRPDSHMRPVTHTHTHETQGQKWVNLGIISSSSVTAVLIGFDIAHNHLVQAPAATIHFIWDAAMQIKWNVSGRLAQWVAASLHWNF